MSTLYDRFLSSRSRTRAGSRPGRIFSVTRQTWQITDDPRKTEPEELALATQRTASDAADLAREAASGFREHGFHKPSGAWWAADGALFHRFLVGRDRARATPILLGLGITAVALAALGAALRSKRKT